MTDKRDDMNDKTTESPEPVDLEPVDDGTEFQTLTTEKVRDLEEAAISPRTRRIIVYVLGFIALACIVAEVVLATLGESTSDAIMTVAATAVGGIAGLAIPDRD